MIHCNSLDEVEANVYELHKALNIGLKHKNKYCEKKRKKRNKGQHNQQIDFFFESQSLHIQPPYQSTCYVPTECNLHKRVENNIKNDATTVTGSLKNVKKQHNTNKNNSSNQSCIQNEENNDRKERSQTQQKRQETEKQRQKRLRNEAYIQKLQQEKEIRKQNKAVIKRKERLKSREYTQNQSLISKTHLERTITAIKIQTHLYNHRQFLKLRHQEHEDRMKEENLKEIRNLLEWRRSNEMQNMRKEDEYMRFVVLPFEQKLLEQKLKREKEYRDYREARVSSMKEKRSQMKQMKDSIVERLMNGRWVKHIQGLTKFRDDILWKRKLRLLKRNNEV